MLVGFTFAFTALIAFRVLHPYMLNLNVFDYGIKEYSKIVISLTGDGMCSGHHSEPDITTERTGSVFLQTS